MNKYPFLRKYRNVLVYFVAALNAIFMIVASLYYMSSPYSFEDEIFLVKATSGIKNVLFDNNMTAEEKKRFFFVNVAWEKQLIPKYDTLGNRIGNIDITNRASLGKILNTVNQKPDNHEFMLVDIKFMDPSPNDSLLQAELLRVKNTVVSYHKNSKGQPDYPVLEAPLGLSDMETEVGEMFFKYHLIQGDSLKTTPLKIYEGIHGESFKKGMFFDELGGISILSNFILDFRISSYNKSDFGYAHIGDLLKLPPPFLHKMFENKIVVFGDFENIDIHETIYGMVPGPFILVNCFLAIENGDNALSPFFLVFLFFFFFIISVKIINPRDRVTVWAEEKFKDYDFVPELMVDATFYLVYFAIVSLISYFLFNVHLAILVLSFYGSFLEKGMMALYEKFFDKKEEKEILPESDVY